MPDIFNNIGQLSIKLTSHNGKEIDCTSNFLSVSIYQSLLTHKFIQGQLILSDSIDLLTNFPLIGKEKVTINIQNSYDNGSIQYDFIIYKIDKDISTKKTMDKSRTLVIYLYTEEEFNNYTKVSKKFSGTGSSIVQDVVSNHLNSTKIFNSTPDSSSIEAYSNYWNCDKIIDYVCKLTTGTYKDYIFYENHFGYNFKSISSLFEQSPKQQINFDIQDPLFNIDTVQFWQFNSFFDDLMWRKRGTFGNTLYKLSHQNYSFQIEQRDIEIFDNEIKHIGSNRFYQNEIIDNQNEVVVSFVDDPDINLIRTTHLNLLNRYNLVLNFNGDCLRNVGEIYQLDFPSLDNESSSANDSFGGKWLLTEMKTTIYNNKDFKQNCLFCKNSFFNNIKIDSY